MVPSVTVFVGSIIIVIIVAVFLPSRWSVAFCILVRHTSCLNFGETLARDCGDQSCGPRPRLFLLQFVTDHDDNYNEDDKRLGCKVGTGKNVNSMPPQTVLANAIGTNWTNLSTYSLISAYISNTHPTILHHDGMKNSRLSTFAPLTT